MKKIGIVGNGFVGNAIYQNIKNFYNLAIYDIDPKKSFNSLEETINSDIVFICLPTPMVNAEGGSCNLSILNNFFINLPKNLNSIFVIKSTTPIETTKNIQNTRKDLKIIHNPEFLTVANAVEDLRNAERNIFGGDIQYSKQVSEIFYKINSKTKNIFVSSDESEAIKYFSNSFLATKVAYFNLMYDLSQKLNLDYTNLVNGVCSDSRIGFSHTKVPGPDNDRGFGGTCFPKDINALIKTLESNNINTNILNQIWEYNKMIRSNWDWAYNQSAVLKGE